jgi:hypothetical protein
MVPVVLPTEEAAVSFELEHAPRRSKPPTVIG